MSDPRDEALKYIANIRIEDRPHDPYPPTPKLSDEEILAKRQERAAAGDPVAIAILNAPLATAPLTPEQEAVFKRIENSESEGWFCGDHMRLRLARTMAREVLLGLTDANLSGNDVDAAWEARAAEAAKTRCRCGVDVETEPHECPYSADVNNDSETLCTCCDRCARQCADDI